MPGKAALLFFAVVMMEFAGHNQEGSHGGFSGI